MTTDQVAAWRARMCTGKRPWGARGAADSAARMRGRGRDVRPYRCVFCGRWHVGHVPSMETVAAIAQLIRDRRNERSVSA